MAAELITPLDEVSGMPLPILPQEFLSVHNPDIANWHHPWHAESAPQLQGLGGKALRHSRVQLVRATDHNMGDKRRGKLTYHDFYIGPPLPDDDGDKFDLCVIAAAGYVPEKAIDLRGDEPTIKRMNKSELELLRTPANIKPLCPTDALRIKRRAVRDYRSSKQSGACRNYVKQAFAEHRAKQEQQAGFGLHHLVYQYQPMRDFFRHYVLEQDLTDVHEVKIEEFLLTRDQARKERLGRWLLGQAVSRRTDSVQYPYQELRRAGKLHPRMPAEASVLVMYKLGAQEERVQLALQQEQRLREQLGIAV